MFSDASSDTTQKPNTMMGKKEEEANNVVKGKPENSFPEKLLPKEKEFVTKDEMKKDTIKQGTN